MRYLKMLGLAAVAAMALTAFLGASSASATVLCKTELTHNCAGEWDWPKDTVVHAVLENGKAVLNALWTDVECNVSTVQGTTDNTGGSSETVTGDIDVLTFDECACADGDTDNAHVDIVAKGSLEIHHDDESALGHDGQLTGKGTVVTINCTPLGTQCRFGTKTEGTDLGTLTGGNPATVDANATVNWTSGTGDEGSFLCGSTAKWEAKYEVTSPKPLYVATS